MKFESKYELGQNVYFYDNYSGTIKKGEIIDIAIAIRTEKNNEVEFFYEMLAEDRYFYNVEEKNIFLIKEEGIKKLEENFEEDRKKIIEETLKKQKSELQKLEKQYAEKLEKIKNIEENKDEL